MIKISNGLCEFSPDGSMLLSVVGQHLSVRNSCDLSLVHSFACQDKVDFIQWSFDSELILCGMKNNNLLQVFKVDDPEWKCRIDEGSVGLVEAQWSSDSRHILSISEFFLKITVWSLVNKSLYYIKNPKQCSKYLDFSKDGLFMAVVEWKNCKDVVNIYRVDDWSQETSFPPDTDHLQGLSWCPSSPLLCVWDSSFKYKILVYSIQGDCLTCFSGHEDALALRSVTWAGSGECLVVSSCDDCIKVLEKDTWRVSAEWSVHQISARTVVYREVLLHKKNLQSQKVSSRYERISDPGDFKLPKSTTATTQQQPHSTTVTTQHPLFATTTTTDAFSSNGKHFACSSQSYPSCVFVWSLEESRLVCVLVHLRPVRSFSWHPRRCALTICTGVLHCFEWSPEVASVVVLGEKLQVASVKWQPQRGGVAVYCSDKQAFVDASKGFLV